MAANMQQHMGGPGQMMGQQVPKSVAQGQLQQYIYHALKNSPPPISGTWQNSITVQERHVMTMQL